MSDCYKCQFRHGVPGSAHSSCHGLRAMAKDPDDSGMALLETMVATGATMLHIEGKSLVKIDPHGRAKGWAMWPLDFDPIWISECQLYSVKEV